jgi:hypothetical protein
MPATEVATVVSIPIYFKGIHGETAVRTSNLKAVRFTAQCSIEKEGANFWNMQPT